MSDTSVWTRGAFALAGCALLLMVPASLAAQSDAATLRARLDTVSRNRTIAQAEYKADAAMRRAARPTDTLQIEGVRVLVRADQLTDIERASISEGFKLAIEHVRQRFGPGSVALVDTSSWQVESARGYRPQFSMARLVVIGGHAQHTQLLRRPVDAHEVRRMVLKHSGENLARVVPALAYAVSAASLEFTTQAREGAARELAMSWSSPARRCHTGSLPDCRRVLTNFAGDAALGAWFDPPDHRAVVASRTGEIAQEDAARWTLRKKCLDGDDPACTQLAQTMTTPFPLSTSVQATFVEHALESGPPEMLARMAADSTTTDVIALLARGSGIPEDSLIATWQRRNADALVASHPSPYPIVLSTAAWGLLLLGLATRRKPA